MTGSTVRPLMPTSTPFSRAASRVSPSRSPRFSKAMGAGDGDLCLAERAPEPALALTPPPQATPDNDGLLTASKVATLKLNASWVVLSACNTAAGDGTPDAGGPPIG